MGRSTRVAIIGNFGLSYKATMSARALPLAIELNRLGYQTSIFVPRDAPDPAPVASGPVPVVSVAGVTGRRGLPRAVEHLAVGLRLIWKALRFRPDVVYAFKPKGYAGLALLGFWIARELGLRRLTLVLDTDDWEGRGGWADRESYPAAVKWLMSFHERWCLRHADVVSVASRELARLAARDVVYLPNAASPSSPGWTPGDRARGRAKTGRDEKPILLSYTRFVEFGPNRLLDVFERVRARLPKAQLLVVGRGLGDEDAELKALARTRGLTDDVLHVGWSEPSDLPDWFAASDVAVYLLDDTLLNRAKCPMKLLDLLLAGVPVVADRVGQAAEYIVDGQTGRLVPSDNVNAMADAAVELLQNPHRSRAMGAAARAAVSDAWNWTDQAKTIAAAIESAR